MNTVAHGKQVQAAHATSTTGPGLSFELNAKPVSSQRPGSERLSVVLREELDQHDVKIGCNAGDCGACTVLIDGEAHCACLTPLVRAQGCRVQTPAGLAVSDPVAQRVSQALLQTGGAQCGICTPGMLVASVVLLSRVAQPDEAQVRDALGGVLCRCTGYRKIIEAVLLAADPQFEPTAHPVARLNTSSVGQPMARIDGLCKVDATECFADDLAPADALVLRVVRSPHHHARFELGDLAGLLASEPGIAAIFTARDIPGRNRFGVIPGFIDQPVLAEALVRFRGEAIALVVGDAETMARFEPDAFPVLWTPLPALLTPQAAQTEGVPELHQDHPDNVLCKGLVQRGSVETALEEAEVVVQGKFQTGFIEHACIEPEAGYATRDGERLAIFGCTQAPWMDRATLADIMGLSPAQVRIVPSACGGGFGAKIDVSFQPFIALAAWHLQRPVRMAFTRAESMMSTTKRHPSALSVRLGADRDGRLVAMDFAGVFNTGAYASWGPTVANRVPVHASGPYHVPHYRARSTGVYTHCVPAGAFRGFGVPQSAVASEALMDELADELHVDRLELRMRNALSNGQPTVTGQVFESSVGIGECLAQLQAPWQAALADAGGFNAAAKAHGSPWRRGAGVACGWYGCGNTSLPNPSTIKAGIRADGGVCLHQGATDIGQGSNTVLTQMFATTLGMAVERVELLGPDTDATPDAGKTSASRQTFVSGNAAVRAATALREAIAQHTNTPSIEHLEFEAGQILVNPGQAQARSIDLRDLPVDTQGYVFSAEGRYDPPTRALDENGQGDPYALFGYAAQMVVLDVDTGLGQVRLQRFTAAHDVGRAINPVLVEGQIEGGIAQGIGLALMEAFLPGRTENLHDYLIPTIGDVPPIDSIIVEVPDPHGPFGAKGLGEHALIPTAPAILGAIRHACGARLRDLPATPDKVLAAIGEAPRLQRQAR